MMQALNVRNVTQAVKPELVNTVLTVVDSKKADEIKLQNATDLQKKQNFNRFLEAYSDCV
jgi:hypothetical protein